MPAANVEPVMVYLPPEVADRLRALAEENGSNLSAEARRILMAHFRSAGKGGTVHR